MDGAPDPLGARAGTAEERNVVAKEKGEGAMVTALAGPGWGLNLAEPGAVVDRHGIEIGCEPLQQVSGGREPDKIDR